MPNTVAELLKKHRSIRRFRDRPIADGLLAELVACAQQAATLSFVQAYSIIHVTDPVKKAALRAVSGKSWVEETRRCSSLSPTTTVTKSSRHRATLR